MSLIELPEYLPTHDPERTACVDGATERPTNGACADDAFDVIKASFPGDPDEATFADLITGLLHLAHSKELDPLAVISSAVENFVEEAGELPAPYPDQYLHVTCEASGQSWVIGFDENTPLDLEALVKKWVEAEFGGELELEGEITPLPSEYFARIITDGRPPDSLVCWTSGGFFLKFV